MRGVLSRGSGGLAAPCPSRLSLGRVAVAVILSATAARAEHIWVEGESPARSSFRKHGWYDRVNKKVFSGGEWHSHYGSKPGEVSYAIEVRQGGAFTFWVRCNNLKVTQHYRIDQADWTSCDLRGDPRGQMMISTKPDHRNIAWIKLGSVNLTAGPHTISFRLTSRIQNHGGIDCFVLTNAGFVPSGAAKPQADAKAGPADWFAVRPDDDSFSDQSVTDVSALLHRPAGKLGFVQREGASLTVGGRPIKFWGCGANINANRSRAWQERWVRYLAKHGVNMVRQHPVQAHLGLLRKDGTFDPGKLDSWDWWFATLKKQGIYMTWSLFYPHHITREEGYDLYDELPGGKRMYGGRGAKSTSGLVNLEPALQDSEWRWVRALLMHRNRYTGLRYVEDPALAVVEVHNEDCIFWHSPLNSLEGGKYPRHAARLKKRWAAWLKARYGSDEKLRAAWGKQGMRPRDSVDNTNMGIYGAWEMAADGPKRSKSEKKRMGDYIRFLAERQRGYYARRMRRLREIGYQATTITTAWRAGGPAADPANLWCDTAASMISRHNYFGGGVGGHHIKPGKVNADTHMGAPGGGLLAIGMYQVEDRPFAVTEWTSLPPNEWKLEAAPLFAFYGLGLQGWDASYHFLSSRSRMGGGWPNLSSYVTDTPHYIGQFPALARLIHEGHIREAPLAAARRLRPGALFQGIDALQQDFTGGGYDAKALTGNLATPKEVLAIGRVTSRFAEDAGRSEKADWSRYWDRDKKVVRSLTGELTWDYGRRLVTLAAPKTQAILGFAGGSTLKLPAVEVSVQTPFVSLIFTSLDQTPLEASRNILITAMARDKQTGTEYSDDGTRLLQAGGPPLLMEPVQATITLRGPPPAQVNVLDIYGVPTGRRVPVRGRTFTLDGRYQTYYYQIER